MSMIEDSEKIVAAQQEIRTIIDRLESELGRPVESASLERINVTTIQDPAPQFIREFVILMSATPGRSESAASTRSN